VTRITTFSFTARPSSDQQKAIARHVGARRFAWNQSLRLVLDAQKQKRTDPSVVVPRTAYSLINAINGWKRSEGAGRRFVVGSNGQTTALLGLPWRHQVCAQVLEEAAVDLARALGAAHQAKGTTAKGTKRAVGFPSFQKKGRCAQSFRLRNRISKTGTPSITVGGTEARSITLPVLGTIAVREDTRALRRLLRPGTNGPRARVCQVTVALRRGRVVLYVTVQGPDRHPARRDQGSEQGFVGVDLGLTHAVVAARADGTEVTRLEPLRPLERSLAALRRADRTAARQQKGSKNRRKAHDRLQVIHARVANQRKDFLHRSSSTLVKTHDRLCLEDLAVANLVRNRHLARRIADAGWGTFRQMVDYKASWYGTELTIAPRWFPSSRTCSSCRWHWAEMTLSDRVFRCAHCGAVMDRDRNAAVNLALWANAESSSASQAPDPEARGRVTNACGGTSAGHRLGGGGTGPATAGEPAKKQEPALLGDRA
jgi:putative transposase